MTAVATKEGSQKNKWMSLDSATCPLLILSSNAQGGSAVAPQTRPPSFEVGRAGARAEEGGSTSLNEVRHASIKKAARHSP